MRKYFKNQNIKFFIYLFIFFNFLLILKPSIIFYEDQFYWFYLESFIKDLDFNLINQVPSKFNEFITVNSYHPDIHSPIQTSILFIIYLIYGFLDLFFEPDYEMVKFSVSVISQFTLLYLGFYQIKKILKSLDIPHQNYYLFLFSLCSTFIYFSLFTLNSIDIFCFPIACYLFNSLLQKHQESKLHHLSLGLGIAIILTTKITYIAFLLVFILRYISTKKFKELSILISGFLFLMIIFSLNNYTQGILNASFNIADHMLEYSWSNFFITYTKGLFGVGGLFYLNPVYFVALLGIIILYKNKLSKKFNFIESLFIIFWVFSAFFQTTPMVGHILDDHLVGRLTLISMPILYIGFVYFLNLLKTYTSDKLILCFGMIVALFSLNNIIHFLVILDKDHYLYQLKKYTDGQSILNYFHKVFSQMIDNFILFYSDIIFYILFLFIFSFLFIKFVKSIDKNSFPRFISTLAIIFTFMSFLNIIMGPQNVKQYVGQSFMQNKVHIRQGTIVMHHYFIDRLKSVYLSGDDRVKKEVLKRVKIHYQRIQKDIIISTPEFDKQIQKQTLQTQYFKKN